MGALLDDLSVIDHQDLVRVFHGLQPVSDHDNCFLRCQCLNGLHQLIFILRIHIGSGLIQEDHRRVLHHRPGDGDALFFTSGKRSPTLADHRLIAFGQSHNEVVAAGFLSCGNNFFHGGFRPTETDIVRNRIMEKVYTLEHEGEVLHQGIHVIVLYVPAVQRNCSGVHVPETGEEVHQCCFASTGGADDGCSGLFRDTERYPVNDLAFVIGELDIRSVDIRRLRADLFSGDIHLRGIQNLLSPVHADVDYTKERGIIARCLQAGVHDKR